ncbi:MAG TPA: hypothetical protein VMG08_05260 [Allosphingosinicella sp.]|nr:hypothetical protein [Allosphingosinicella sp.]
MKRSAILAAATAALLTASVAQARALDPRRAPGQSEPVPANCPLTVGFSSYGPGIDRPTLLNVERLLNGDRGVRGVSRHRWGREGEITLCARTRSARDAARLAQRIRAMIPARPRGPVRIELAGRLRYETPAPRH